MNSRIDEIQEEFDYIIGDLSKTIDLLGHTLNKNNQSRYSQTLIDSIKNIESARNLVKITANLLTVFDEDGDWRDEE